MQHNSSTCRCIVWLVIVGKTHTRDKELIPLPPSFPFWPLILRGMLTGWDPGQEVLKSWQRQTSWRNEWIHWSIPPRGMKVYGGYGFPGGSVVKNLPVIQETGVWSLSGRFPGERNGNPLQYSCLENSTDRGAWRTIFHRDTKSWTWLSD